MRIAITLAGLLSLAIPTPAADPPQPTPRPARLVKTLPGLTVDLTNRRVIGEAYVCLREDALEFAACSPGTKEHESLLVLTAQPKHLHLALLLAGIRNGRPARWEGERFFPPTGDRVKITLRWQDPELEADRILTRHRFEGDKAVRELVKEFEGRLRLTADDLKKLAKAEVGGELLKELAQTAENWAARRQKDRKTHTAPLHTWIRSTKTQKIMPPTEWIFAGSRTMGDGTYWADGDGTIVTVSNFESAVLDVPMRSTATNEELMWEANSKAIPAIGTKVEMIFTAAAPPAPKQMTIRIAADGSLQIKGKPVTAGKIESILAKLTPTDRQYIRVVIAAEAQTPFEHVVQVLDLLSEAKIPRINFSVLRKTP